MKRKTQRAVFVGSGLAVLALAVGLAIYALDDSLSFFLSPTKVVAGDNVPTNTFRIGGMSRPTHSALAAWSKTTA